MTTEQVIPEEAKQEIEKLFKHLPHRQAACIDALKIVQKYKRCFQRSLGRDCAYSDMSPHRLTRCFILLYYIPEAGRTTRYLSLQYVT